MPTNKDAPLTEKELEKFVSDNVGTDFDLEIPFKKGRRTYVAVFESSASYHDGKRFGGDTRFLKSVIRVVGWKSYEGDDDDSSELRDSMDDLISGWAPSARNSVANGDLVKLLRYLDGEGFVFLSK